MDVLNSLLAMLRRSLPTGQQDLLPEGAPERSQPEDLCAEFASLQSAIGAEPGAGGEADRSALKDLAIAGLQQSLAELQPLGELLARSEGLRIEAERELARTRAELDMALVRECASGDAGAKLAEAEKRAQALSGELRAERTARVRAEERGLKAREKAAERQKVAAERWRDLRAARAEVRKLERELAQRASSSEPAAPLRKARASAQGASAGELMQVEERAKRRAPRKRARRAG